MPTKVGYVILNLIQDPGGMFFLLYATVPPSPLDPGSQAGMTNMLMVIYQMYQSALDLYSIVVELREMLKSLYRMLPKCQKHLINANRKIHVQMLRFKRTHRINRWFIEQYIMPEVGIEPTRGFGPAGF